MAAAASKKGKKQVNQEELRRLMREKQRQTTDKRRVDSPFARYSSLGGLSCSLCGLQLKSELLWPAHVLGKTHKEKVAELKMAKQAPQPPAAAAPPAPAAKRKASEDPDTGGKKARSGNAGQPEAAPRSAGLSLLAGCYDEDEEEAEDGAEPGPNPGGLPMDFFDSALPSAAAAAAAPPAVTHSGSILKAEPPEKGAAERKDNTAEALPEGFFDDPVRDAKVRNVDAPKEQMDKEWEEFQKEIRQVNTRSEAIVAEDDEEGRLGRQIDEIDEQIECYKRVEMLRDKRDVVKSRTGSGSGRPEVGGAAPGLEMEDDDDEEDEEELLGLLSRDWRAKGALA